MMKLIILLLLIAHIVSVYSQELISPIGESINHFEDNISPQVTYSEADNDDKVELDLNTTSVFPLPPIF